MFTILEMTEGARAVAANDPHGWTLTVISISVVFCALLILFIIYSILGDVMSGALMQRRELRRKRKAIKASSGDDARAAAAIAVALHMESGGADEETAAAIAAALDLYLSGTAHDDESYVLTFGNSHPSPWADKSLTFRKYPSL